LSIRTHPSQAFVSIAFRRCSKSRAFSSRLEIALLRRGERREQAAVRLQIDERRPVEAIETPDLISDLVHKIENLKESDAKARLFELEDAHEKTYFEIGGVLSVMQKEKWYTPCASLDEWIEKNTGMKRSKARALIQIYGAIVKSEVKWAHVKLSSGPSCAQSPGC